MRNFITIRKGNPNERKIWKLEEEEAEDLTKLGTADGISLTGGGALFCSLVVY